MRNLSVRLVYGRRSFGIAPNGLHKRPCSRVEPSSVWFRLHGRLCFVGRFFTFLILQKWTATENVKNKTSVLEPFAMLRFLATGGQVLFNFNIAKRLLKLIGVGALRFLLRAKTSMNTDLEKAIIIRVLPSMGSLFYFLFRPTMA